MPLNQVQQAAYELIQADARFLYTLIDISKNATNIDSNYICMALPYIGLFADGAEQWSGKLGLSAPKFNDEEKKFYTELRSRHKVFDYSYANFSLVIQKKLAESEDHFYNIRSLREKIFGYYNVGTDLCNGTYCGNTILCAVYIPHHSFDQKIGPWIKKMSIIAGKLAASFDCQSLAPYKYSDNMTVNYKDYHFFRNSPIKRNDTLGFVLFSILCCINYTTCFMEEYFVCDIVQKFKFAYLQYYYLCGFIEDLNMSNGTDFKLNDALKNRDFRNCLAHYGLGQYITEKDIKRNDPIKGLTIKAFSEEYDIVKHRLFRYLHELKTQIYKEIF